MYIIIFLLVLLIYTVYNYCTKHQDYWAKRNVKYDKPVPFFGNLYENVMGVKSITEVSVEMYNKYPDESVVGFYRGRTPELIVRDLDIVRNILSTDFEYFYLRGLGRDTQKEPAMANIFQLGGDKWKLLRKRLTGAFTTAKLKNMFPLIVDCAKKLQHKGDEIIKTKNGECDVRELMARFTTEFIGACGFGIQMDTINNERSLFRELGKKIFRHTWRQRILLAVWDLLPSLGRCAQTLVANNEVGDTIEVILKNIREQRNYKSCGRNDFVDLLLELEAKGTIYGDSIEKRDLYGKPEIIKMTMDTKIMAAQMYVFFAAGFETSSSAISYTLHELAFHQEIQAKIQTEIDEVLKQYNDTLSYDSISQMTMLSCAFKEAMRIFPVGGVITRECARRYTIPELDITIDPGVKIMVPVHAIQNDEKYFDNPSEFKPERFVDPVERHKYAYLPFGEGPRQCIGARLGEMQSLAGLAVMLQRYTVEPATATLRHPETDHTSNLIQNVVGGLPLKLKLRKNRYISMIN